MDYVFPSPLHPTGGCLQKVPKTHARTDEFPVTAKQLQTSDLPGVPQGK